MADQIITFETPSVDDLQRHLDWATKLRHDTRQPTVVYQLCDALIELCAYALAIELHAIDRAGIIDEKENRVAVPAA